ncbi:aminoglycoside phosphotransferase family protein [Amycolatopsis roodepoortensis]|uniref:aminoglycoside phosphotransferase family protein n=1 Tax=Amycolatopsis roodepoortensis TaxID=700274 RepID=UPI00214BAC5B|nr:aminoglycoside phosphotransferase family protein [Amycolatopsis roodepoortensis]UUV31593.1 aminoglycoside phosphotransferase family protein [Amycolatopsis roodepoortensis]
MVKMHADEADIDAGLVRSLVRAQFPQWAGLPVRRSASGGTVNAIYRLGERLSVRLPLTQGGVEDLRRELRWLPRLAPLLPVAVPEAVAVGEATREYPWPWAVYRWIDGEPAIEGRLAGPERVARDLAAFVLAMREVDLPGGPVAHRGGPLAEIDREVRAAMEKLRGTGESFDAEAAMAAWDHALAVPGWSGPPCWVHSDLMPSNLLVADGGLAAVLDFGTVGVGDPASDLIPAWNLLTPPARETFRGEAGVDADTWSRGRGWALGMAIVQLPYYRATNPVISANARFVVRQVLADFSLRGS